MVREGRLALNRTGRIVVETEAVAVVDGEGGFGQVVAERSTRLAIDKARRLGVGMAGLRNSGHVGRLGDWAEMAAAENMASIHLCNGTGSWNLVVPFGGRDPRTSTNPFAIAMPVPGGPPVVLDFATSAIAEGKVRVALNKEVPVPEGCLLDKDGHPTRDPKALYEGGALLPFGYPVAGHKGGGLQLMCDLFAGLLSLGRCSYDLEPGHRSFSNHLLSIVMAPELFAEMGGLAAEARRFVEFIKGSRPAEPGGEVLMPGEPERRNRAERSAGGVPLDPNTWAQLLDAADSVGLDRAGLAAKAT
jgi:hydroxycarboxylate dehydrogenase B